MKISKKDQDPRQIDRDREGLAALKEKECMHFKVGTNVIMGRGRRGTILRSDVSDGETVLCVTWTDGSISYIKPIALNR